MKRSAPSPSSSSSSSSSCIQLPAAQPVASPVARPAKRCRAKRTVNADSAPPGRSSVYRGVTRHRWTGRYEAHLWDKSTWNNIQNKKGRQIYLGAYESEEAAARTYDLAALKYWGASATLNFPVETYDKEIEEMQQLSKEEYLASLRRQSSGFSRGVSKYRGVARSNKQQLKYEQAEELNHQEHLSQPEFQTLEGVLQRPQVPEMEFAPPPVEGASAMLVMDPAEEHDSAWNICLDPGFEQFLSPSDDLFSIFNSPFDDDIDSIFGEQSVEKAFNQDGIFNSVVVADAKNAQEASASPSSTVSTASVSSEVGGLP